jgi:hypothetical protein
MPDHKRSLIVVLFALLSFSLTACGDDPPFVGDWTIDVPASLRANNGNPKTALVIRNLEHVRLTFEEDEWTMTVGDIRNTKGHTLVDQAGDQYKLAGDKGGSMLITMKGSDRMWMRDENERTMVLVRAKS